MKKLIIMVTMLLLILVLNTQYCFARDIQDHISTAIVNEEQPEMIYLGQYRVTFYCGGACCCGQWANSPTASGAWPEEGRTIACGSNISFGTKIYIEGFGTYICQDRGVPNQCIDIYVDSHQKACQLGLQYLSCYLVQE